VSPADFMRFLFCLAACQPSSKLTGVEGLEAILGTLDDSSSLCRRGAFRAAARIDRYDPSLLDVSLSDRSVVWAAALDALPGETTPARDWWRDSRGVCFSESAWPDVAGAATAGLDVDAVWRPSRRPNRSGAASCSRRCLSRRRPFFPRARPRPSKRRPAGLAEALGALVAAGLATSMALPVYEHRSPAAEVEERHASRHERRLPLVAVPRADAASREAAVEQQACRSSAATSVVFRRLLGRRPMRPLRELAPVYQG